MKNDENNTDDVIRAHEDGDGMYVLKDGTVERKSWQEIAEATRLRIRDFFIFIIFPEDNVH